MELYKRISLRGFKEHHKGMNTICDIMKYTFCLFEFLLRFHQRALSV